MEASGAHRTRQARLLLSSEIPRLFEAGEIERRQAAPRLLAAGPDIVRCRDQAVLKQVALRPDGALLGELGNESAHGRDGPDVCVLHVHVERPGARILKGADRLVGGNDAVDGDAF